MAAAESECICGSDRFVVLHYNAHQRQLKREEVLLRIEEFEQQNYYKPKITKKAQDISVSRSQQRACSPEAAHERLYQEAEVRKVNRQVLESKVLKPCTFQPEVTRRSRSPSPERRCDRRSLSDLPFPERLHPSEEAVRERRRRLEEARRQKEVKGCTFKPRVNPSREPDDMMYYMDHHHHQRHPPPAVPPVYERLNKYYEAQQMRLKMMREIKDKEELEGVTFHPTSASAAYYQQHHHHRRRQRPAAGRQRGDENEEGDQEEEEEGEAQAPAAAGTVFERLAVVHQKATSSEQPECTFKPSLRSSQTSRDAIMEGMSLQERFEQYKAYMAARKERRIKEKEAEEKQECTFSPSINTEKYVPPPPPRAKKKNKEPAATAATKARPHLVPTDGDGDGGYDDDEEKMWACTTYYGRGAAPAPPAAATGGGGGGGGDGAVKRSWSPDRRQASAAARLSEDGRRREKEREKERERREMEGCTFKPKINRGFVGGRRREHEAPVVERLVEAAEAAKKHQEEKRKAKERKEMEACTFQPSLQPTAKYKPSRRPRSHSPARSAGRRGQGAAWQRRVGRSRSPLHNAVLQQHRNAGSGKPAERQGWKERHPPQQPYQRQQAYPPAPPQEQGPSDDNRYYMRRGSSPSRIQSTTSPLRQEQGHSSPFPVATKAQAPPRRRDSHGSRGGDQERAAVQRLPSSSSSSSSPQQPSAPPPAVVLVPAIAAEDEDSLRQEIKALALPEEPPMSPRVYNTIGRPVSPWGDGGAGGAVMRKSMSAASRTLSLGGSSTAGSVSTAPGERLKRFQEWRKTVEEKMGRL